MSDHYAECPSCAAEVHVECRAGQHEIAHLEALIERLRRECKRALSSGALTFPDNALDRGIARGLGDALAATAPVSAPEPS